ncbi:hypothetical protein [Streptomyces sp. NPDC088180]|uniref:hypothetical protein n=1 Tax=Streptomyces sp. NPDC088180 TaxID=3365837 RepID=UPI0037FB235E
MSESVDMDVRGDAPSGSLLFRHVVAFVATFLIFWGVTLLVELFSRVGDGGACGRLAGVPCEEGSALLALGAPAFIIGILLLDGLDRREGWTGPAYIFAFHSYFYAAGGIGLAFAWNVVDSDSVLWSVFSGAIALALLWLCAVLAKGYLKGFREKGGKQWARETFWILENLPQSKKKRRRMLRSRGQEGRRAHNGHLIPETSREKRHWALFAGESLAALLGGVIAAVLFVQYVSGS